MGLPAGGKVNTSKVAPNSEVQRWNVHLRQVDVRASQSVDACDGPPINNRKS